MAFPRPRYDIADIVRLHRVALETSHRLSRPQKRVLTAISRYRTAALGGHLTLDLCQRMRWQREVCACGYERPAYNSCRNRHCPKCQAVAQEKWIAARAERILPVRHFHLVFTPPSELRPLARRHPTEVYTALFRSASELLLELGRTRLNAAMGLTMVLHTCRKTSGNACVARGTRELHFHPHVHVLATAGGLSLDGRRFVQVRKDFLFPVKVMGQLLRGKMLDALRKLRQKGAFPELTQTAFNRLMASLAAHRSWVVYSKAPFRRSRHVLSYLGRYTHRVGIANSRLLDVGPGHVTFRTRGNQTATLRPVEFLRRFTLHVLPDGFHKIRHAGLYASAQPGGLLEQAKALLPPKATTPVPEALIEVPRACPHCGSFLQRLPLTAQQSRAPPLIAV